MSDYKEVNAEYYTVKKPALNDHVKCEPDIGEMEEDSHETGKIKQIEVKNSDFLDDLSPLRDALVFFTGEANEYIQNIYDEERKKSIIEVTDFIFETINNYQFDLKNIAIELNFWEAINDLLINSPDDDILHQMMICVGVSLEKHPEIADVPSFSDIIPSIFDALDRNGGILMSPAFKIISLSQKVFDKEIWEKVMDFIKDQSDETLQIFHELLCRYAKLSYNEKASEYENEEAMKIIIESIYFILCERRILDGSLNALLIVINNIGNNINYWTYFFSKVNCSVVECSEEILEQYSNPIEFIFKEFVDMPENFIPDALEIIYRCLLHLTTENYLKTILKNRFEKISEFAESPDPKIRSNAIKIICVLFEDNKAMSDYNIAECMDNIIGYLEDSSFDIKKQVISSISKTMKYLDPELIFSFVQRGCIDLMLDVYDADNMETKRDVIEGLRRIVVFSPQSIEKVMENLEFLLEERFTDEQICGKIDIILALAGYTPEED